VFALGITLWPLLASRRRAVDTHRTHFFVRGVCRLSSLFCDERHIIIVMMIIVMIIIVMMMTSSE
jgi:hypothetical protein